MSQDSLQRIAELLGACGTDRAVLPPTALYNEGWMARLVVDWFARQPPSNHPLSFEPGARWYSEALLPTQFRPRHRGDELAEAWTHADAVIGHFEIVRGRGDVRLVPGARQFVVVEAKMYSALAAGTKRAQSYNQAARNVACIAEVLHQASRSPESLERLALIVLAPAEQISQKVFADHVTADSLRRCVCDRATMYGGEKDAWLTERFLPLLDQLAPHLLAWEEVVAHIGRHDPASGAQLESFLASCIQFNRPRITARERSGWEPRSAETQ